MARPSARSVMGALMKRAGTRHALPCTDCPTRRSASTRGAPGQARVGALGVVIGDPLANATPQLGTRLEGAEVDAVILRGSPEPLDEDVVHLRPPGGPC